MIKSNKFLWYHRVVLTDEDAILWEQIERKALFGYHEWYSQYAYSTTMCPPWTQPLTKQEDELLHKVYSLLKPDGYIVDPLGYYQISFIMYNEVKEKVKTK